MSSLRARFSTATLALVAFQLAGAGAAAWSAARVRELVTEEAAIAGQRARVLAFGEAVREQYVHQAHTFLEGGPGHLDHYAPAADAAAEALAAIEALDLPDAEGLRARYAPFDRNFREGVIPIVLRGDLDRPMAAVLHASSEELAHAVLDDVTRILDGLAARQAALQAEADAASRRARLAALGFFVAGVAVLLLVTRALAAAVLRPLDALADAAARFGAGDRDASAPLSADRELRTVAEAFNRMVAQVRATEDRRVRTERLAALGEMSGAVAHELMNPLTTILGSTDDPAVRDEAQHARRVVEGLLGFARPGREAAEPVDVLAAARAAADRLALIADARDVTVRVEREVLSQGAGGQAPPQRPPTGASDDGAPAMVTAPPSAVRQVLDNLLRNAVEAAPPGSAVELVVRCGDAPSRAEGAPSPPERDVVIEVRDRGPGIPASLRPRLYEPFATGRPEGTGLGLAVCQRIVGALGGNLAHADRPGGGTVATWRFHA